LNFESQKFSKSRGWGVDLDEFLELFPADALRYTLAMNLPELRDADFTWKDFQARTNNELADILGNFVNRTLTFVHRNFAGKVPARGALTQMDQELIALLQNTTAKAGQLIDQYRIRDSVLEVMNLARFANKYFNDNEPWKSLKDNRERCATTINLCLQTVRSLAILLEPVTPFAVEKMWKILNLPSSPSVAGWQSAAELLLPDNHQLGQPEILFAKIEDEIIQQRIQSLSVDEAAASAKQPAQDKPRITIDDFKKVELKVAKVISVEKVPKSDKLLKIQISLGEEQRQVIAGIAQHYSPDDLIGKKVVVVVNLQPAKLMGQESNGMLLAASDDDGHLSVLTVARDMIEGSKIK
jgi:methionyl-tRNA synthetase